jgi:hypothetical protein
MFCQMRTATKNNTLAQTPREFKVLPAFEPALMVLRLASASFAAVAARSL